MFIYVNFVRRILCKTVSNCLYLIRAHSPDLLGCLRPPSLVANGIRIQQNKNKNKKFHAYFE